MNAPSSDDNPNKEIGFEILREAVRVIEDWEADGSDSAVELAKALYKLFMERAEMENNGLS
jgi:hypothetical protein